jgi:hypothetical protein
MELVIEVASDDPLLGNRILLEVPVHIGAEVPIPNTSAKFSLSKMPPEWDKKSKYNGVFTFAVKPVDPDEAPQIATWLQDRFFGHSDRLAINGLPIGDDVIGNSRYLEVIREALVRRAVGSDQAKVSMILCLDLEPAEREKVERLDGKISERFLRAGIGERIFCRGSDDGAQRLLTFLGASGIVSSVSASNFLAASDPDAVEMIELAT